MKKLIIKFIGKIIEVIVNLALQRNKYSKAQIIIPNHNIFYELQKRATEETVEYINNNMQGSTIGVYTNETLMKYALDNLIISPTKGLVVEFGVDTGTSVNFISNNIDSVVHGFDSFYGLPESWSQPHTQGFYQGSITNYGKLPKVNNNVKLYAGWFEDTLPKFLLEHDEPFAYINIDCDIYSSTKTIFDCAHDRIIPGTIIQFDEYFNYPLWKLHEYKAFQEFIKSYDKKYEYLGYTNFRQVLVKVI